MHVLIFTPVFPPNVAVGGGVAITYGALRDKLELVGHTVTVLSPRVGNLEYGTSLLYKNFPVIFPTRLNLGRLAEEVDRCDVVVMPDDCMMPFVAFVCAWKRKPLLFNIHTNVRSLLEQSEEWVLRNIAAPCVGSFVRLASHLSTETFTTSPSYRDQLVSTRHRVDGVFSPRIKTAVFEQDDAQEDVDLARVFLCGGVEAHAQDPSRFVLMVAGRMSHEKRIESVIAARPANCIVAVVGDGPNAQEYVERFHNPGAGVCILVGMQDQARLRVLYKACDYLVSASKFETLGMTVVEAHLCGTPVAVQNAAGFSSQVLEGRNGWFVDFDDAESARERLSHAIRNRPSRASILKTVNERWDGGLPDLDSVVTRLAEENMATPRADFYMVFWVVIAVYWVFYTLMGMPFNTLTYRLHKSILRSPSNSPKSSSRKKVHRVRSPTSPAMLAEELSAMSMVKSPVEMSDKPLVVFGTFSAWFYLVLSVL